MTEVADRAKPGVVHRFTWPAALGGGLLLVAFSLVPWGVSDEGVRPSITGLGRVSVPGAGPEDVAFLEDHTLRPGLVTVVVGIVIAVAAAAAWWRPRVRWPALIVIALASIVAMVAAVLTVANPAAHLLDDQVNRALDLDTPLISPGYGLIGVVVVSIGIVGLMIAAAITRIGGSS
ncbi:hypothetical protein [Gordonia insulae]|uniref:Tryptophan-associated transmembrane protein n=1 Tax=Gordonia insulae TaxID=2420509 RepID=A0A3G8JN23_9ACTN|nr:hypothetical protein [Gordonia insulae]AZG45859.1 hypothetical protein D7316_02459 [Gordonia insulae]